MVELTKEEHKARAILLGLEYKPMTHSYRTRKASMDAYNDIRKVIRLDADTLEPLSGAEEYARYKARISK